MRLAELVGLFSLLFRDGDVEQCWAASDAARLRLAKMPKWQMRTSPLGKTWMRNRRRNSSAETVMIFCILP